MQTQLKTPLYDEHLNLKAQMAPFGGWLMPIQYSGILAEHKHCRSEVSLFDICHMGEFLFQGDISKSGLENAVSFNLSKVPVGKCKYGFMLNADGGILDDLIIYKKSPEELMIVVNAATTDNDFKHIKNTVGSGSTLQNISGTTAKLDLQGPQSRDALAALMGDDICTIPYFGFKTLRFQGMDVIISRTGYTGELGYELYVHTDHIIRLWELLLSDKRVKPAGLGARDILRLEVGYSLYGNDIDTSTTPIEAGFENYIDFNKDFIGKEALIRIQNNRPDKVRIAFEANSRRSPRQHYKIICGGNVVGEVTSGCFSPILSRGIGIGYVSKSCSSIGTRVVIQHDDLEIPAEIVQLPFYKKGSVRS